MATNRQWIDDIRAMPPDKLKGLADSLQVLQDWKLFKEEFKAIEFIRDLVGDEILNRENWT